MIHACIVNAGHSRPSQAFVKNGVDIYVCPTCGCIMANLDFVHEQYESRSYYTMALKDRSAIDREWGFRWRYVLKTVQRYSPGSRLLDVGAGNGFFVYLARIRGLEAEGLEISEAEVDYARKTFGVQLSRGELADVAEKYDVVSSFNVLEHVTEPIALLSSMSDRLSAEGILVLTTPSPASIQRRLTGLKKWAMVCPPHHINLFPRAALFEMLAGTGLEILAYETLSTYINFVRKFDTENLLLRRIAFQILKGTHLGADHFVVCRKQGVRSTLPS